MESDLHQHRFLSIIEKILDFILLFAIAILGFHVTKFYYPKDLRLHTTTVWLTVSALCTLSLLLYHSWGVYQPMRVRKIGFFAKRIFWVNAGVAGSVTAVLFLSKVQNLRAPILWLSLASAGGCLLLLLKKCLMITFLRAIRTRERNSKHVILITDSSEMTAAYMDEIRRNPAFGYAVTGYVGDITLEGLRHLGGIGSLDRILTQKRPDEVVLALESTPKSRLTGYISICNDHCVKVMVIPSICGYFRSPKQVIEIGNLPVIDLRATPLDDVGNRMIKRLMDILGSLILIVLTSPLMLFTAVGVRLSSSGPILFRQTRVGKQMQCFTMYKFRSMYVNNAEQTGWSQRNDPRKTPFGAFIRKLALDELPQLFNVLRGDMSLVGPRPEVPFYVDQFKKEIPLYTLKHSVRPGITGLAQIKGLRGDTSIQARINEDLRYIEEWSLWLDVYILLATPFRAVNRQESMRARRGEEKNENR